jgi:hypothetical protein
MWIWVYGDPMSYTTPPSGYIVPEQPGGRPARPGTVSFAGILLYVLALISFVSVGLALYQSTFMTKEKLAVIYHNGGYPQDQADAAATFAPIGSYVAAGFSLLVAILYILLAVFVNRGKQWARVTTWVVAGLFGACCNLLGVAGSAASSSLSGMGAPGGIDSKKIAEDIAALSPSWLPPVGIALSAVALLAALSVIILLALPPSHPFFRKVEPVWTPPTYPAA